jgi:agmatinase
VFLASHPRAARYPLIMTFDPNAAAADPANIFGLPHSREDASIVLIPIPYDATSS